MESSSVKGDLAKFSGENPVKKSIIRWFLLSCLKIEEIEYVDLKISKSQCLFLKDVFSLLSAKQLRWNSLVNASGPAPFGEFQPIPSPSSHQNPLKDSILM